MNNGLRLRQKLTKTGQPEIVTWKLQKPIFSLQDYNIISYLTER